MKITNNYYFILKGEINLKTKSLVMLHAENLDGIGKVYMTGNIEFR